MGPSSRYARCGKRLLDLALVVPALVAFSPLLLVIAALVRLTSRGPAFFRQERLGRYGHTFQILKFRTMTDKPRTPDLLYYTGDPSEVTAIGRLLRRTKLDELPQLINVLRGEMTIVGPRPQLPVQLADFDENARLRLVVRPGLTGMTYTHGGIALNWSERWYYDAQYVKQLSFALDLRLIARTFKVLIIGEEACLVRPPRDDKGEATS